MCPDSSCSNAQVSASCAGPNSKSVIAVVKLEELPATLTSLSTGTTMTTENMLLTSAVEDEAFELPKSVGATLQRDDIRIALEKTCAVGFQRFGDTCDCGEGTFKKIANDSIQCDVCPAGSYQDRPGRYSCNPCPAGTSTTTTGADEQSDCTPTGKAVADTSTSGSGVSAALIGSIVGGLLGLLAVLLVVFTVYRVFKKGGPMQTFLTARRFHEEHGYYGLFTAQATHGYGDKEGIEMRQHMGVPASLIIPELPPRFNNGEEVYDYIADDDTARYVISPLRQAIASAPDDVEDECYLHPVFGETTSAEIDSQDGPSSFKPKLHQFRQHEAKSTCKDDDDSGSDEDLDTPPADYEDNVFDVAEVVAKSTREDGHDSESDEDLDAPPADYEDNVFDMAEKWTEEKKDPEAVTYIH
ncbi:uncharacterized protein [Littorina saxatilis]|uniref:uncharacterized protein n=1 Tax=Littorina saxatilis TaxID=31220 RepID=UPI0038B4EA73